jgi:hypothetical protein
MVMPSTYRQGYIYTTKNENHNSKRRKSLRHCGHVIKKAGQTMLRRTLKRDMMKQLEDE